MTGRLTFDNLPLELRADASARWEAYRRACKAAGLTPPEAALASLPRVWACSEFVARNCVRHPTLLNDLVESGDLQRSYPETGYRERLAPLVAEVEDETALMVRLRTFRRREMVRIAWRDLAGWADLEEILRELSWLADACVQGALARLEAWLRAELGTPTGPGGEPQSLVVLGMGKLGACELNYSSDIDLIFAYPEDGETTGGPRALSNEQFFTRLGQGLIRVLNEPTADGFVFRVDMRLRPFGDSSPLVSSFEVLENYYQTHGREWERYAMVKARVVAGEEKAGEALIALLRPFVYRRYLDYGAFSSLREMKRLIESEVRRKGMENNIKLGAGGIREVEFIGQAFQLIRGGREPALQERRILAVLQRLEQQGLLPEYVVRQLTDAYRFLRRTEHRLQEYADQQTHTLPEEEKGRMRLAYGMGFGEWDAFKTVLDTHRRNVQEHFEQVFAAPQTRHAESDELDLSGVWRQELEPEEALQALRAAGYQQPEAVRRQLDLLYRGRRYQSLSERGKQLMDRLMPLLLGVAGRMEQSDEALGRVLQLLERILQRTVYLSLLVENPVALSQLVKLCAASPWITRQLGYYPLLLDELLDPRLLYAPPGREELEAELRQRLLSLAPEDLDGQMEQLRSFRHTNVLRVAAADVMEALPLMVVSDHLTDIAEVVLERTLDLAWEHLVERHGCPPGSEEEKGFAIIAYGKLGGIELSYGSDLDLVFIHGGEEWETDGPRPVASAVFYARLAQRIIHILTTQTAGGMLYEVDTRLRPSGASGLLVSGFAAFASYQREKAWTWEHQALVRARPVCGSAALGEAFQRLRREVLSRRREEEALRREVLEMRRKMYEAHAGKEQGRFYLKQDPGGITDIEFMVQYAVLAWSHAHPELLDYTDNIRILERLGQAELLAQDEVELLADAYRLYRARLHRLVLQEAPPAVDAGEFDAQRNGVIRLWRRLIEQNESGNGEE